MVLFLVGGAMVSTLFFALVPALQSTRLDLVRAIHGEVVRHSRPGCARDALVALQQRTREIGVRMALGATSGSIGALVLSRLARPVGIGLLLGGSLTAALGAALLATPAAEMIGASVRLFDPTAYAVRWASVAAGHCPRSTRRV